MEVSRAATSVTCLASAALGGAVALLLAAPANAADPTIGPPTLLFSPSSPAAAGPSSQPAHGTAVASPGRHPAVPVQRIPLDAKPLIPPAALSAKLGPPPEPRPALSLETDLEPLAPATPATQPGTTGPLPAAKSPSS